jgi:flagellin
LNKIDKAINTISEYRSYIGAKINRYEFKINNLNNNLMNTEATQIRIEDTNFAASMAEITKSEIKMNLTNQMLKINNSHLAERMQMLMK